MASYAALRHVSIGQYIPTDSVVHRLDARVKWLAFAALLLAIVLAKTYSANALLLLAILSLVRLAQLPVRYLLRTVKPAIPIIVVLSIFQLLFYQGTGDSYLLDWGWLHISRDAVRAVVVSLGRFFDLLFLISLLTNTTTASQLTQGMERLLKPLDAMHLPGHEIAMMGAIALRFLPILGEEMEAIMQARESRRLVEQSNSRWQVVRNAREMASLLVPLFVDAFRRAELLILAMQARCYAGGRGRTSLIQRQMTRLDWVALCCSLLVATGIIVLSYTKLV